MRNVRSQFIGLFIFLAALTLLLTNGFWAHIHAEQEKDLFRQIEPLGGVLAEIMKHYVESPDVDKVVEGGINGMMNSLDDHSSYVPPRFYQELKEDTEGRFDGIGIQIKLNDDKNIVVFTPIPGSPAAKSGILPGDIIVEIDGKSTKEMNIDAAKDHIRGEGGTVVTLRVFRPGKAEGEEGKFLDIGVTRGQVQTPSLMESRVLKDGVGYVRVSDFKQTTARDLAEKIKELEPLGMQSLILDLRWNPGGLLSASEEVASLFLKKNMLVTYTRGRPNADGTVQEDITLYTDREPVLPQNFPIVLLVNEMTASSSEIVTGALQYHKRALIIGAKTFGKGSVQTIIPLPSPRNSALRLTTAYYYTPAEVTINKHGILPDIDAPFPQEKWEDLLKQMMGSWESDATKMDQQNHGSVTGDAVTDLTVEDVQLQRAVEILSEDQAWEGILAKYHKDTKITQVAAIEPTGENKDASSLIAAEEASVAPATEATP
ncbi:MAG: S41 family peptidase [Candidatus Hydrogenedentes bacterium]|nr:S41 family peptidase [Candidatus Hydrogenedentota bacterium]